MNTAVTITVIICAVALINSGITALRDVAKAKHHTRHCDGCTCRDSKES